MHCKLCRNTNLVEHTQEVTDIEDEFYLEVSGYICNDCGCFHYSLNGFDIAQFDIKERINTNACASWVTDYKAKIMQNEVI